jgi:hypothetical protein
MALSPFGCALVPWAARFALAAGLLLGSSSSVLAAEPPWLGDLAAATAQAQKQGKLLLVVHLSGDFTAELALGPEADIYRTVVLSDARVTELLKERFVVLCQAVGPPSNLRPVAAARTRQPAPRDPLAITYIALPDGRVLHFIPGFLSSDQLLAELAWVESAYPKLLEAAAADQPLAVRNCHLAQVAAIDRTTFASAFASRWENGQLRHGPSTVDLPPALRAARATFARVLAGRVAAGSDRRAFDALAAHGSLGVELAHLVLAEFPLVDLSDLARPAFEACAQRRYWSASLRREQLVRWQADRMAEGQPLLLVVADDPFAAREGENEPFAWPPASAAAMPQLVDLSTQVVSIDELAQLIADAGWDSVTYKPAEGPPRFLIYEDGAKPAARISQKEGTTRLAQAITAMKRGAVAVKVVAGEGADDEK